MENYDANVRKGKMVFRSDGESVKQNKIMCNKHRET